MVGTNGCRECKNRYPGCHGKCSSYKEWRKSYDETKKLIRKKQEKINIGYYHK